MVSIPPSIPYIWVPDSHVDRCTDCKSVFTMITVNTIVEFGKNILFRMSTIYSIPTFTS